nr:hypothetical protein [uncultured Mediterraneibacter sp.]
MILQGPILIFDKPSCNNFVIPKTCDITIPDKKLPVAWSYDFVNSEMTLGFAELDVKEDRIVATVESGNELLKQIMKDRRRICCGGYFNCVKVKTPYVGLQYVLSCTLRGLGLYESGDDFIYLEVKE